MFTRAAEYIRKVLSYPSNVLSAIAMVAMVVVVLSVTADVFMRNVFGSPISGVWDICTVGFCMIVWGPMALTALAGRHIQLTFLLDRFPRLPRLGLELIISLVTSGMLGMVSWRLVMHGILFAKTDVTSATLKIPYAPFVYIVAASCGVMALVFLAGVPEIVGKIRKER